MSDTTATKKGEVHYNTKGDAVSFVGEAATRYYQLVVVASGLKLEMKVPGLKLSRFGSALKVAKHLTGLKTNNRAKHLARIEEMITEARASLVHIHPTHTTENVN